MSALLVFPLITLSRRAGLRDILEYVARFLIVAGISLGIVALAGIRKHGTKGILATSLVGLAISGLLLFIFVTNFMAARGRAQRVATPSASAVVERVRAEVAEVLKRKSSEIDTTKPLVAPGQMNWTS